MKLFFEKVRTPKKDMSLKIQIMVTIGIIVFGFALGVFQKWMAQRTICCHCCCNNLILEITLAD